MSSFGLFLGHLSYEYKKDFFAVNMIVNKVGVNKEGSKR